MEGNMSSDHRGLGAWLVKWF